ncbi:glycosyltransferase family 2 protein [Candidatus Chloroploca sp. Khr17]|uniref:glycosyltransferase family 2 protein n=1 Tax=Candidatus Chloroploca sp. Khr17 TaxID=2496869 RepID=UPI00101B9573|nr:glycosyltransferase family 2 protein [Candidatus Chloroploca sp. Khr17]
MPLRITAAICTHNRASMLPAAIESLLTQTLPATDYEILVIDNASTDATPQIIQRYLNAPGSVTLRSAVQPVLGLSHARNLAVGMAEGEIIAFLDDDAVADSAWLAALLDAYAMHPDAWAVGGKVLPLWQGKRPRWLTDDLLPHLSMLDLGAVVRPLQKGEALYGVNFSCRRCAFDAIGLFRSDLGRQGIALLGSEESEFQQRVLQHGQALLYTPHAIVKHRVMAERLQKRYFIRRAYGKGRTNARLMMSHAQQRCTIGRRIIRGWLGIARQWLMLGLHPLDKGKQLDCMQVTATWLGFTLEAVTYRHRYDDT